MSSLDKLSCSYINLNNHQRNNRSSRVMQKRLRSAASIPTSGAETQSTSTTPLAAAAAAASALQQTSTPLMNYFNNQRQEPSELEQEELHPVVKINSTSARRRTAAAVAGGMIRQQEEDIYTRSSFRSKDCIMTMRPLRQAKNGLAQTSRGSSRHLICLVPALAALFLLAACLQVSADGYANGQQQLDSAYQSNGAANTNHYDHQQQQAPSKAKKIQIVYIKVPLAKLKPSLANATAPNNYNNEHQANGDNSTAYASQQHVSAESTTKQQGSQSVVEQRKQLNAAFNDDYRPVTTIDEQQQSQFARQQQSSFLIPMAVVSSADQPDSAASAMEPSAASAFQPDELANLHRNYLQQQQQNHLFRAMGPMMMRPHGHAVREQPREFSSFSFNQPNFQQSPMQFYQQLMSAGDSPQASRMVGRAQHVQPGFMSSFLLAEKERMAAAAMRLAQQQQMANQLAPQPPVSAQPAKPQSAAPPPQQQQQLASASSATNAVTMQPATAASSTELLNHQQTTIPTQPTNPKQQTNNSATAATNTGSGRQSPGGLMPVMMMPLSHMPDTMIGQAYNAAVGQALPSDTGSPSSLLSSPSNSYDSSSNNNLGSGNKGSSNYATGGNNGIAGDSGSSLGTSSSTSYGANGHNQQDATSSGTGYQQSASGSGNFAQSSGYGSGINTFGASVAFSDFPAGSYGAQPSSSNNHPLSHSPIAHQQQADQHQQQQQQAVEQYAGGKLRQAKKTIIPIVVQVEHAILENNAMAAAAQNYATKGQQQQLQGNRYGSQRGHRQVSNGGNKLRGAYRNGKNHGGNSLFGSATNDSPMMGASDMGAQYLNAANAQDINQITAQINAENAASAAAALAQADMAFGNGPPAYLGANQHQQQHQHQHRPMQGARPSAYAAGLQSAASALLANTHPVIQAAASGGLASVSKLGAKLGEMIALPSMQVPNSISALPSALSSMTSQMGVQMSQAIQQVAKEHPTAHAFARQVAQHAGIQLPNFVGGAASNIMSQAQQQPQHNNQYQAGSPNNAGQQMSAAASNQQPQQMSPQAQLQNLKLSIGQNLQTAAAQLIGVHQKANAQSAASLLANPLAALYPQSMNAALKQLSGGLVGSVLPASGNNQQQAQVQGIDSHHAQSSSLVPVQQQPTNQQQQQLYNSLNQQAQLAQLGSAGPANDGTSAMLTGASEQQPTGAKPAGKPSLKSKFLSFFQPPKFISNLLSWNDRADARNDQGAMTSVVDDKQATAEAQQAGSKQGAEAVAESAKASVSDKESVAQVVSNATANEQAVNSVAANKETPVALGANKDAKEEQSAQSSAAAGQTKQ